MSNLKRWATAERQQMNGKLSQRAARAMSRPGFPNSIMEDPGEQRKFILAVAGASCLDDLSLTYQKAILSAENGAEPRMVTLDGERKEQRHEPS